MNPLNDIYLALLAKVRTVAIANLWFDLDMGQLDEEGNDLPLQFPAVLVKFEDVIWKTRPDGVQIGTVNIAVKFAFQFKNEAELISTTLARPEVTECLNNLLSLHTAIDLTGGASFSQMMRYNQYQQKTNPKDLLWVQVLQYQCNIQSNGVIDAPLALIIDYNDVKDNNAFMDRKKFNKIHK